MGRVVDGQPRLFILAHGRRHPAEVEAEAEAEGASEPEPEPDPDPDPDPELDPLLYLYLNPATAHTRRQGQRRQ